MNASRLDIRILIVGRSEASTKSLVEALKSHTRARVVGTVNDSTKTMAETRTRDIDVVIVEANALPASGIEVAEKLKYELPDVGVILVVDQSAIGLFQKAIRLQVNDFLVKPIEEDELSESVTRTFTRVQTLSERTGKGRQEKRSSFGRTGQIISVVSARGGTGKSIIASSLAANLVRKYKERLLLLDLDLQYGDIDLLMGVKTEKTKTIRRLGRVLNELSPDVLETVLCQGPNNMRILLAPPSPLDSAIFEPDSLESLLIYLQSTVPLTIIDTSTYVDERFLICLRESDLILLLITPDLLCVRDTAKLIKVYQSYHFDASKLHLVVNKVGKESIYDEKKLSNSLGTKVIGTLPYISNVDIKIRNENTGKKGFRTEDDMLFLEQVKTISNYVDKFVSKSATFKR